MNTTRQPSAPAICARTALLVLLLVSTGCSMFTSDADAPDAARVEDLWSRALAAEESGRIIEASAVYRELVGITPGDPEVHYRLGNVSARLGDLELAIKAFQAAVQTDPTFKKAYNNLGTAFTQAGEPDKAIVVLRRLTQMEPRYARGLNNLGVAYNAAGQYSKALLTLKRALELQPEYGEAYNNLGNAYSHLELDDEAVAAYKRAMHFTPSNLRARYNLGATYVRMGDLEAARVLARELEGISPELAEQLRRTIARGEALGRL